MSRRLVLAGVVLSAFALLFVALGPQQGLEALGGVLVAYAVLLYHLAIGPLVVFEIVRERRLRPGKALMLLYLCTIYGLGLYAFVVTNDIDDAVRDRVAALVDPQGHRVRELARILHIGRLGGRAATPSERDELVDLIAAGAPVNERDEQRPPALWNLAAAGDADLVAQLLARGAVTDDPRLYPSTPLLEAVRAGHAPVVLQLLAAGADPNAVDRAGKPALVFAAERGDRGLVAALLDAGADVDAANYDGSAFARALDARHTEVVELLLQRGAAAVATGNRLPIEIALTAGDERLVAVLQRHTDGLDAATATRDPLLFQAVAACDLERLRDYLARGASPTVRNRRGDPLGAYLVRLKVRACDLDAVRPAMMQALLDAGLAPDTADGTGSNLLPLALSGGQREVARRLADAGADLTSAHGRHNVLTLAAGLGMDDLVERALATGVDIDHWPQGLNAKSALYAAVLGGQADTVRLLFARGARLPEAEVRRRNLYRRGAEHPAVFAALLDHYEASGRPRGEGELIAAAVRDNGSEASIALARAAGVL